MNTASHTYTHSNFQAVETGNTFFDIRGIQNGKVNNRRRSTSKQLYSSTTTRNQSGRYIVEWPLRTDQTSLCGSFSCFKQIEKRFQGNITHQTIFIEFMKEYLSLGFMQVVGETAHIMKIRHFLPHHPIFRDTTRLRVVFHSSMKTDGGRSSS